MSFKQDKLVNNLRKQPFFVTQSLSDYFRLWALYERSENFATLLSEEWALNWVLLLYFISECKLSTVLFQDVSQNQHISSVFKRYVNAKKILQRYFLKSERWIERHFRISSVSASWAPLFFWRADQCSNRQETFLWISTSVLSISSK